MSAHTSGVTCTGRPRFYHHLMPAASHEHLADNAEFPILKVEMGDGYLIAPWHG